MPASEGELNYASLLYYLLYEEELPKREYRKQDIRYIIELLMHKQKSQEDFLQSDVIH
ncbi:hypothetical protein DFR59_10775 [Falsibacillus pallidus]|uniref:Uncharacterized protein n=1 Tax=Falsibacillus pallidus TaxID=493781 RepID=A0A370GCR1_9BACI|nr:hypothetical protein DFR59_10775 [Falsibacillus pallidus]